ncbi:hypothetical protein CYMTET_24453, partial [Cymbomonas tetramitiformis]
MTPHIFTIGHSDHTISAFIALCRQHNIRGLIDVRSKPGSGRYPQFNKARLAASCEQYGIEYQWCPALGGKGEEGIEGSLLTSEGQDSFEHLCWLAGHPRSKGGGGQETEDKLWTMMCSEGAWRQCHRQVLAAELSQRGVTVEHILRDGHIEPHPSSHHLHSAIPQALPTSDRCCHHSDGDCTATGSSAGIKIAEPAGTASPQVQQKTKNQAVVKELKQRLGSEAYTEFRAFSQQFQNGALEAEEYRDHVLGLLASAPSPTSSELQDDRILLLQMAHLLPASECRTQLLAVLHPLPSPGAASTIVPTVESVDHIRAIVRPGSSESWQPHPQAATQTCTRGRELLVLAVRFHHILDEHKRHVLVAWAHELQ